MEIENIEILFITIYNTYTMATLIYITLNKQVVGLSFEDA